MHSVHYTREAVAKLAEVGLRPAAIAAHLDADYDLVARDISAARASGRSISAHGSGPLPRTGRPCPHGEVIRLTREGLRACDIATQLGDPATDVNYHLRVARRAGELPPTARSKPGPVKQTLTRWSRADDFPPSVEAADRVAALGLDHGLPMHEICRMLWLGARRTQIAKAIRMPVADLARLSDRLRSRGMLLPRSAPGRFDIVRLPRAGIDA